MPWIDKNQCSACGICIEQCPANAISWVDNKAAIDMQMCIRCGTCHDACPREAVRHDSEKIPELVKNNLEMTKKNMELCAMRLNNEGEKAKCLARMKNHFNKEKIVAEKTLEVLEKKDF